MTDRLNPGQTLKKGDELKSPNRNYTLTMQGDGNLCLRRHGQDLVWQSGTEGCGDHATMQGDGNFVVYGSNDHGSCWNSGSAGNDRNPYLILQDDGNLCVYSEQYRWGTASD